MVYVTVWFIRNGQPYDIDEKEFHSPKMALRFIYSMEAKGHIIIGYRCDDPLDNEYLNKRLK